jgi:hypothetical protein
MVMGFMRTWTWTCFVRLDVRPPEEAEFVGCIEHALAIHLDLCKVQHDGGGWDIVQRLADESSPELLLERTVWLGCRHVDAITLARGSKITEFTFRGKFTVEPMTDD